MDPFAEFDEAVAAEIEAAWLIYEDGEDEYPHSFH